MHPVVKLSMEFLKSEVKTLKWKLIQEASVLYGEVHATLNLL